MLGGTSGLNYMLYVRGNKADFDGWAELGNDGWSFEEVRYFLKLFSVLNVSKAMALYGQQINRLKRSMSNRMIS
jgi:choline dehydrogenase-like flavoprotein